jgi:hypothetical protein
MRCILLGAVLLSTTLVSAACDDESAPPVAALSTAASPTTGSGAAAPTSRLSVAIPAIPLASLAGTRAGLETPLLVPRTLPPGYQPQRIIHDVSHDRSLPWMNAVRLYYGTAAAAPRAPAVPVS